MKKCVWSAVFGLMFGLGLSISKMTDPQVVLDFFDISAQFNPILGWTFIAALTVTMIGYYLVLRLESPLLDKQFFLPQKTKIDTRLISGAIIFGIGWGISGYCPAPMFGTIAFNFKEFAVFSIPMVFGFWLARFVFHGAKE